MLTQFSRTELLTGREATEKLHQAHVLIFGIGGVGGNCTEALARAGVGHFTLVDDDNVSLTNINRQLIATHNDIGKPKVEVMKKKILSINPDAVVITEQCFYLPETKERFIFEEYDYVVDCIDTVTAKLDIIETCIHKNVPIISSMGTGNRLDPTKIRVMDVYKTAGDPLAKIMRHELKKRHIKKLKVVTSLEEPLKQDEELLKECMEECPNRRSIPGSSPFVPPVAGITIASEVVRDLIKK